MIKVVPMKAVAPGNPYLSDQFHMGSQIGKNVEVMYAKHLNEEQAYIIVVNMSTGERVRVMFAASGSDPFFENFMNKALGGAE